ncbi:Myosin type-2 heavy chain 1 [Entophlyctis sp. JEL0112]|nr:Myosin type-2 heavy chain 1 [Entophlyctis sp. JEL0112]
MDASGCHYLQIHEVSLSISDLEGGRSSLPLLKNPDFMDNVDDLSLLSYLHEPAVLDSIKSRFFNEQIYTYSGMVLIAVNPFKNIDLYSLEIMREFCGKKRSDLMPHIFGIAEESYRAMHEGRNQSIIVSGESGAGKTQSSKYLMQYLAAVDAISKQSTIARDRSIEDAVLASNPILEAFGNAKTTRNNNSSRFGKFVQLMFSNPALPNVKITGAVMKTYLLERSRLSYHAPTERNYHIFYQLCAGAPVAERKELSLGNWSEFNYLKQGNAGDMPSVDDSLEFKATQEALSVVGVPVASQWKLFEICAALLHLGNVSVISSANGNDSASLSMTDPSLFKCCELLGIDAANFSQWITKRKTIIRGETFVKDVKVESAISARDSVTKVIYTKLFDWLVETINKSLSVSSSFPGQKFIGILDIYGFEHFKVNSFEQFCINYANEKLQQEFNSHVFRTQQEEYVEEGIPWEMIEFSDNLPCLNLIEAKPSGILSLLDEESRLLNGSDSNFVTKLNANFAPNIGNMGKTSNAGTKGFPVSKTPTATRSSVNSLSTNLSQKFYAKARFGTSDFVVKHYAADVQYSSVGFIEKNMDSMSEELFGVLEKSTNEFFKVILLSGFSNTNTSGTTSRSGGGPIAKKPTLGTAFRLSLQELMETIRQTETHYVRCIKPNSEKSPSKLDGNMVLNQLRACGVLETIKISNAGYPNNLEYNLFASRYNFLAPAEFRNLSDLRKLCELIVNHALPVSEHAKCQFGKTKLFFKGGMLAYFESRLKERMHELVIFCQKNVKRNIAQRSYLKLKSSVGVLQTGIRGYLARKCLFTLKETAAKAQLEMQHRKLLDATAVKIQSACRMLLAKQKYVESLAIVIRLQTAIRVNSAIRQKSILAQRKTTESASIAPPTVRTLKVTKSKNELLALETKILSLSQKLYAKVDEFNTLQTEVGGYKAQLNSYKDQFKSATEQITSLKQEIVELKAERDSYKVERDMFARVLNDAIQGGLDSVSLDDIPGLFRTTNGATTVSTFRLSPAKSRLSSMALSPSDESSYEELPWLKTDNISLKRMIGAIRMASPLPPESPQHRRLTVMVNKSIYEEGLFAHAVRDRLLRSPGVVDRVLKRESFIQ